MTRVVWYTLHTYLVHLFSSFIFEFSYDIFLSVIFNNIIEPQNFLKAAFYGHMPSGEQTYSYKQKKTSSAFFNNHKRWLVGLLFSGACSIYSIDFFLQTSWHDVFTILSFHLFYRLSFRLLQCLGPLSFWVWILPGFEYSRHDSTWETSKMNESFSYKLCVSTHLLKLCRLLLLLSWNSLHVSPNYG